MKAESNTENIDDKILAEELEEMRGRMSSLRERLNSQQLVTDRLLRDVVRHSTDYSRKYFKMEKFFAVPVGVLSMIYLYYNMQFPLWYLIFTVVMLVVSVFSDWRTQRITHLDYGSTPLLEIQQRFVLQKRRRAQRMLAGMIMIAVWLALGVFAVSLITPAGEVAEHYEEYITSMIIGAVVGGVIGLWFGISAYLRMQRDNEQAIRRLRDFTDK